MTPTTPTTPTTTDDLLTRIVPATPTEVADWKARRRVYLALTPTEKRRAAQLADDAAGGDGD